MEKSAQIYLAGQRGLVGSSCTYPRDCSQPMKEEMLLTGPLESTNRPDALAKIAGIEMCSAYNRQYDTRYGSAIGTYPPLVNIGSGTDVRIRELAELLCEVVGFKGALQFDTSKPDGTPRKLMDVSRLTQLGWTPVVAMRDGVQAAYEEFKATILEPH